MDLGKSIRIGLARENQTHEWLAFQLDASRATVSNYCAGKTEPGAKRIEKMAEIFGMTVSEFIALGEK